MAYSVNVECWSTVDTASNSTDEIFLYPRQKSMLRQVLLELLSVKSESLRVVKGDAWIAQGLLMFVKKVVHVPEFSLSAGSLSSFSSLHRKGMGRCQGKVSEDKS